MEARSADRIPSGKVWEYEPKWDGFRCLVARDGREIHMISKSGQDLRRYFPGIAQQALGFAARRFVLDGELVVPDGKQFSFDLLRGVAIGDGLRVRLPPVGRQVAFSPAVTVD